jgi:hypothetical protein
VKVRIREGFLLIMLGLAVSWTVVLGLAVLLWHLVAPAS